MSPRRASDVRQVDTVVGPLWVDRWDHGISKALSKRGSYEPEWTSWWRQAIRPGMQVIDVGANLGYFTILFGQLVGPHGRVLAIEPDPFNRDLLERNIRAHDLDVVVTVAPVAVTDVAGTCQLHLDQRVRGAHSLSGLNCVSERVTPEVIDVSAMTLDHVAAERAMTEVDLVKVDAQGAEARILSGAAGVFSGDRPMQVVLELWPKGLSNCGSSLEDVLTPMQRWGFVPFRVRQGGGRDRRAHRPRSPATQRSNGQLTPVVSARPACVFVPPA